LKTTPILLPALQRILTEFGLNLKLARLRRRLTPNQVSERANIARSTLWLIEKGSKGVSIGNYLQVMHVLGIENDLMEVGKKDALGRTLQDIKLLKQNRHKNG
jgi:transcriptional regulator with XRE-family HTH domain